ncbi:hypothetical protein KBD75_04075 [Candidatus Woesebacteria bacterium]|nr:hypothetical protein [Candidatus Woesebacteria bacterium]
MNARFNYVLKTLTFALAIIAVLFGQVSLVAAQTPDPWDPFCSGSGALVIQEESNTGDGVAMSAEDAVANWQCGDMNVLVGYVEPWDGNGDRNRSDFPDKFNPESMVVGTPKQLLDFAERTGLDNGSWWIVDERYASHPLVVYADKATNADNLGLNPMENQIDLDRMGWVRGRMEELYGVQKYVNDFSSTDLLAQRVIQLGWATTSGGDLPEPGADDPYVQPNVPVEHFTIDLTWFFNLFNFVKWSILFGWIFMAFVMLASFGLWLWSVIVMWRVHWLWGLAAAISGFLFPVIVPIAWLILHKFAVTTWPVPAR